MSTVILIALPEDAPIETEQLLARPLGGDVFEVISAPFVTYDVHKGDRVRCSDEDPPEITEIIRSGGHATVRVLFDPARAGLPQMRLLLALKELGLVGEEPRGRYVALDAPPGTDLEAVADLLEAEAQDSELDYEIITAA